MCSSAVLQVIGTNVEYSAESVATNYRETVSFSVIEQPFLLSTRVQIPKYKAQPALLHSTSYRVSGIDYQRKCVSVFQFLKRDVQIWTSRRRLSTTFVLRKVLHSATGRRGEVGLEVVANTRACSNEEVKFKDSATGATNTPKRYRIRKFVRDRVCCLPGQVTTFEFVCSRLGAERLFCREGFPRSP